jgi:hypothetical protein
MSPDAEPLVVLLAAARTKLDEASALVAASLADLPPFEIDRAYSPKELEPFDALCDRFVRAIEVAVRYFRALELNREAMASESFRDLLHRMEKYGVICDAELWFRMRNVRNRIVHDYLPEERVQLFEQLRGEFGAELARLLSRLP